MDPLTITTTVLHITATCVGAAKSLNDMRNAWKRAPATVSSLCSQLKIAGASLSQIQSLLLSDTDILQEKPDLVETFDTTLTSCLVLSTWLESYMNKITKGVTNGSHDSWKIRLKALWNEGEVNEFLKQLQAQQNAISVLVGLLQMDSVSEIKRLVRRHEALLQEIASNTRKYRSTYSIEAPKSIYAATNASEDIYSNLPQVQDAETPPPLPPKKEEPERLSGRSSPKEGYKPALLYGNAYAKAVGDLFSFPYIKPMDEQKELRLHLTPTVFFDGLIDANTLCNISKPSVPIGKFMPVKETFLDAKTNLNISSIHATVRGAHTTEVAGELNLVGNERLTDIQKVNEYWYWGSISRENSESPPAEGLFERSQVVFGCGLSKPLVVKAKKAYSGKDWSGTALTFEQGEELEILRIYHGVLWFGRQSFAKKKMQLGFIKIDDIEIDDSTKKQVDAILDHFSCDYPDFLGASGTELQQRMTTFINLHTYQPRTLQRMYAHCRSFGDLQILQRAIGDRSITLPPRPDVIRPWRPTLGTEDGM